MEYRTITLTSAALLLLTVVLAAYAQLVWKARALLHAAVPATDRLTYIFAMLRDPWIWSGLCATGFGTVGWMLVLRHLQLSVAYPAMALVFVLVPLGAHYIIGEPLPLGRIFGLAFIVLGVVVVARTA